MVEDQFDYQFLDGTTLFQHFFMRLAFLPSWKSIVPAERQDEVFERIEAKLNEQARHTGKCKLTVPFVVINCEKTEKSSLMPENSEFTPGPSSQEVTFDGPRLTFILLAMIIPFYIIGDRLFHFIWVHRTPVISLVIPIWVKAVSIVLAIVVHELIHGIVFAHLCTPTASDLYPSASMQKSVHFTVIAKNPSGLNITEEPA